MGKWSLEVVRISNIGLQLMTPTPDRMAFVQAATQWVAKQKQLAPGRRALCINEDCNAEYDCGNEWSLTAITATDGKTVMGGICPRCVQQPDLQSGLLKWVRHVIPDAEIADAPAAKARTCGECSMCC